MATVKKSKSIEDMKDIIGVTEAPVIPPTTKEVSLQEVARVLRQRIIKNVVYRDDAVNIIFEHGYTLQISGDFIMKFIR